MTNGWCDFFSWFLSPDGTHFSYRSGSGCFVFSHTHFQEVFALLFVSQRLLMCVFLAAVGAVSSRFWRVFPPMHSFSIFVTPPLFLCLTHSRVKCTALYIFLYGWEQFWIFHFFTAHRILVHASRPTTPPFLTICVCLYRKSTALHYLCCKRSYVFVVVNVEASKYSDAKSDFTLSLT